ncbi:MAG: hypothetical protein HUK22_02520, partial [Thermoguttaceae bacterium]|nr:hypothetical protein [Thermoguttaceae bacterium]
MGLDDPRQAPGNVGVRAASGAFNVKRSLVVNFIDSEPISDAVLAAGEDAPQSVGDGAGVPSASGFFSPGDGEAPTSYRIAAVDSVEIECAKKARPGNPRGGWETTLVSLIGNCRMDEYAFDEETGELNSAAVVSSLRAHYVEIAEPFSGDRRICLLSQSAYDAESARRGNPITSDVANNPKDDAIFRYQDFALSGDSVEIDGKANVFRASGPGAIELPISDKIAAQFAPKAESAAAPRAQFLQPGKPAVIEWSKGLEFDGRTLRFLSVPGRPIVVSQPGGAFTITGPTASVELAEATSIFDFNANDGAKMQIASFSCGEPTGEEKVKFEATGVVNGKVEEKYVGEFQRAEYAFDAGTIVLGRGGVVGILKLMEQGGGLQVSFSGGADGAPPRGREWNAARATFSDKIRIN